MNSYNSKWSGQSFIIFMAWAYLAFVIYGSCVPFDFHPELASQRFLLFIDPAQFAWSLQSKADIVTNVLLTIPLVFFWSAFLTSGGQRNKAIGPVLAFLGSAFVSVFVEWAQIFFLPRDPSLVDITSQLCGSFLSLCIWFFWGKSFIAWIVEIPLLSTVPSLSLRLLVLYGIGLFAYGLVPLDLTLSVTDFYRKFRDGKVLLIPFWQWHYHHPELLYGFITDIALWVPIGLLARQAFHKSNKVVFWYGIFAAALLEFFQLFVLSRVSDSTQVIAAGIGTFIGIKVAKKFSPQKDITSINHTNFSQPRFSSLSLFGGAIGWFFLICIIFWYPYNFQMMPNSSVAREILNGVPLEELFYQSELRALTELLRKTLFFAPLGIFLGLALRNFSPQFPKKLITMLLLLMAAALVEIAKFFLPGKFPSSTNIGMEFAGGVSGFWAINAWIKWQLASYSSAIKSPISTTKNNVDSAPETIIKKYNKNGHFVWLGLSVLLLGTFLWGVTKLPQIPYNVRNLPHPSYPYISMILVAAALIWSAGFPFWITRRLAIDRKAVLRYPLWLLAYGAAAWVLVFFGVEPIRAYKIVGAPILHWPWHVEWILRFLALMAAIGTFAVLGSVIGGQARYLGLRFSLWVVHAVWLLPLLYWAIIAKAATDNLTELLAWNASPIAALLMFLVIANIFFAVSLLHQFFEAHTNGKRVFSIIGILVSFPIGYWFLQAATEPVIMKYEKVFSGMQFILSSDRNNYAQPSILMMRYFCLHAFLIVVSFISRWLFINKATKN